MQIQKIVWVVVAVILFFSVNSALATEEIIVSASATLTNVFTDIGQTFEKTHPDVKVVLNFGAAGDLVQQIVNGAPVDVFASANQKFMNDAEAKNLIVKATRTDFTGNGLVMIIPADSVFNITEMTALTSTDIQRIALGKPESVSAGQYAAESLKAYGLWEQLQPKYIYGNTVRQVLDYVQRGEVDVGFVFASDALIAGDKVTVALAPGKHTPITYPIAVMTTGKQAEIAKAFVAFVLSDEGQAILKQFGFERSK